MAASGVGAAIALASLADELPGEIVFLGTPAEERGSGKQIMIDDGLFEGLDAALLYHPCDRNHVESYPLASEDVDVVYTGLQSHASSDPWRGKNALDALILLFTSVGLWRQQLPSDGAGPRDHQGGRDRREHHPGPDIGVVHDPERERVRLRGDARPLPSARARPPPSRPIPRSRSSSPAGARTMRNNRVLAERFRANMAAYGIEDQGDDPNAGSTDMANVSWVAPTIHPDLAIAPEGTPGHSILFRDAAVTPRRRDPAWRDAHRPDRGRAVQGSRARRRGVGGVPHRPD
jgi:metal-dependent amidase/aminoacylase/carboxypeptidase family protein